MTLGVTVTTAGVLAVVSPVLTVGRAVPQTARLVRSGASGVSAATWILIFVTAELWCAYGVFAHVPAELAANIPNGALALVVVVLTGRRRAATGRLLAAASILTVTAAVLVAICVHDGVSGIVSGVAVMGSITLYFPQVIKVLREPDVTGVSLVTWMLALASAISWGVYGLLIHKLPVFLPNVVMGPCAFVIVMRVALRGGRGWPGRRNSI